MAENTVKVDIHEVIRYICDNLDGKTIMGHLSTISPDNGLLLDIAEKFFVAIDADEELTNDFKYRGRKISVRGKNIILCDIVHPDMDPYNLNRFVSKTPIFVGLNREDNSVETLMINMKCLSSAANYDDSKTVFNIIHNIFAFILGDDKGERAKSLALFGYIEFLAYFTDGLLDDYYNYSIKKSTDFIRAVSAVFGVTNDFRFTQDVLGCLEDKVSLYYYPSLQVKLFDNNAEDEIFELKSILRVIEGTFENQTSENKEERDIFVKLVDALKEKGAEGFLDYREYMDFENQYNLFKKLQDEELQQLVLGTIVETIEDSIKIHGIQEVKEATEEEKQRAMLQKMLQQQVGANLG